MEKQHKILTSLGLTDKESRVYLALHEIGEASAYKIAQHTAIKRPTVYVTLDELRQKDLVVKLPASKQLFRAKSLEQYVETKQKAVTSAYDLAEQLKQHQPLQAAPVYYFEGFEGVKQAVHYKLDDLEHGRSSAILGHLTDDQLLPIFQTWHETAKEAVDFSFRALISGEQYQKNFAALKNFSDSGGYVETRLLTNTTLPHNFSFEVFEKHEQVAFLRIVADKDLQATIIETHSVAHAFLHLFESLWDQSERVMW